MQQQNHDDLVKRIARLMDENKELSRQIKTLQDSFDKIQNENDKLKLKVTRLQDKVAVEMAKAKKIRFFALKWLLYFLLIFRDLKILIQNQIHTISLMSLIICFSVRRNI